MFILVLLIAFVVVIVAVLFQNLYMSPIFLTMCRCGSVYCLFPLACRLRLKCDGTRAETRFRLSAKRTSPFKSAGALVQSTTGSRVVRSSCSNAGYTMF